MTENSGLSSSAPLRNLCLRVSHLPRLVVEQNFPEKDFWKGERLLGSAEKY